MFSVLYNGILYIGVNMSMYVVDDTLFIANNSIEIASVEYSTAEAAGTALDAVKTALSGGAVYLDLDSLLAEA